MTAPAPSCSAKEMYEENVKYEDLFSKKADLYRRFAEDLLRPLKNIMRSEDKRLIDIGCGGGFAVEAAMEMGFIAEGVEANAKVVEWCKGRGLNVIQGDIKKLLSKTNYDVVVLSAVLEHLPDPEKMLTACKKILNPGGVILIQQAVYDGLLPSVFPWGWYGWQPKEHFWHFTPASLDVLFDKCGFRKVHSARYSLHHPWFLKGSIKELAGRNLAAVIARIGANMGRGDGLNIVISI